MQERCSRPSHSDCLKLVELTTFTTVEASNSGRNLAMLSGVATAHPRHVSCEAAAMGTPLSQALKTQLVIHQRFIEIHCHDHYSHHLFLVTFLVTLLSLPVGSWLTFSRIQTPKLNCLCSTCGFGAPPSTSLVTSVPFYIKPTLSINSLLVEIHSKIA